MTLKEICGIFSEKLKNTQDGEIDLRLILKKVLSFSDTEFILNRDRELTAEEFDKVCEMIDKRIKGMPVQYILGEWDFYGKTFTINENVLIPRPETEILCEYVIEHIKNIRNPFVADLCSGSGCIGITVKTNKPDSFVLLVEKSVGAISCSDINVRRLTDGNDIVTCNHDVFDFDSFVCANKFDVIVSNPPYINSSEIATLQSEVLLEPRMALDGGEDGLDFYRAIISGWKKYLKNDGIFAFECGENQASDITDILNQNNFDAEIIMDFNRIERIVIGKRRKL